ncbi:MAG: hypothetical protein GY858_00475 [Candidatus Omnitrophica bacterium]|nr:hypothetical protein [Candidatus Omnitrophota bacterium]
MSKIGDGEVNRLVDLTWNDPKRNRLEINNVIHLCHVISGCYPINKKATQKAD